MNDAYHFRMLHTQAPTEFVVGGPWPVKFCLSDQAKLVGFLLECFNLSFIRGDVEKGGIKCRNIFVQKMTPSSIELSIIFSKRT